MIVDGVNCLDCIVYFVLFGVVSGDIVVGLGYGLGLIMMIMWWKENCSGCVWW